MTLDDARLPLPVRGQQDVPRWDAARAALPHQGSLGSSLFLPGIPAVGAQNPCAGHASRMNAVRVIDEEAAS
ncbi:hypothetical protein ACIO3O_37435 [Streptomyces sp. NPDC087440]|uniref:hypothetical protein n=1 Tax=Streptomyces sp. NPDC087440 TaxID=3365790 RepID=UPI003818E125